MRITIRLFTILAFASTALAETPPRAPHEGIYFDYLADSPLSTADDKNQKELPPAPVHSPAGPFVTSPTETVRPMSFGSVPAGRVGQVLIQARREEPNAVLLATLSGTITVTNAPLRVPSRTCVIFAPGGPW